MNTPKLYSRFNKFVKASNSYILKKHISDLDFKPKENIFEVGCGVGESTRDLLKFIPPTFNKFVSTDVSDKMIEQAHVMEKFSHSANVQYERMDISTDTIENKFLKDFHKVFSLCVLHWVPMELQSRAFNNMNKLLTDDGCLFVFFPIDSPIFEVYAELYKNPKWAQYMKHAREFSSPYNHTVKGRLSILENILNANKFKIHVLSMTELMYKFETYDEFFSMYKIEEGLCAPIYALILDTMRALNPFESRLPENLRDQYWEDSMKAHAKLSDVLTTGYFPTNSLFVQAIKKQDV